MEHRGNSCEAVENSDESSVQLFRRSYSHWRKEEEVEWHSCLSTFQRTFFWSRSLKIGVQNFRKRFRCLQHIYRGSNKIRFPVLQQFQRRLIVHSCFSGTRWWERDGAWVDVSSRYFIEDALEMSLQSSSQDSSLGDEKAKKEDRPSSSHLSTLSVTIQTNKNSATTYRSREKYTTTASGNRQDAVYWNLARAQDKGQQIWQTRSHALIVCSSVPAETPRPAPEIVLKSAWQSQQQQQQQQQDTSGVLLPGAPGNWCEKRTNVHQQTTQNHRASGNRREVLGSPVEKEEPEFKVDLRVEGIAQDVILKSGWQTTNWIPYQINHCLEKTGNPSSSAKSRVVQFTIARAGTDPEPSNASLAWSMYRRDWFSDEEQIQTQFEAMIVPYHLARVNYSRGNRHGEAQWQKDHWKAKDAYRGDGRMTKCVENLRTFMGGQKIPGLLHDDRHLFQRNLAPAEPARKHHLTFVSFDNDRQAGPMRARKNSSPPRTVLRQEGRQNVYIPKNERARQRPFDEALRADREWHRHNWKTHWSQTSTSSFSQQWRQHEHQDTQWRD